MLFINHIRQKTKVTIGALSGVITLALIFVGVLSSVFAHTTFYLTDASVELDGVNDGYVTVSLKSPNADEIYSVEGNFTALSAAESTLFTLTSLTPADGITPASNDIKNGRIFWQDATWVNPITVEADGDIWTATYKVEKDVPAGTYPIYLFGLRIAADSSDYDTLNIGDIYSTLTVTRTDTPSAKLPQTIILKDGDDNDITGSVINKYYGDEPFKVTWEHTVGDGEVSYHPDDGEFDEHVARTAGDYIEIDNVGSVNICAWVSETEDYAPAQACITVNVLKRPLDIVGATIADKTFDGTTDATVTDVTFEDINISDADYTATAVFGTADAGENKGVRVTVSLVGAGAEHYVLNSETFDTTKTISPFMLTMENAVLFNGEIFSYDPSGIEPEVRVTAEVHGGVSTLVEGSDYDVSYSENKAVGTGHVSVAGLGNYTTGENPLILDFTITAKGINNSNLTVPSSIVEGHILTADEVSLNVDGHELVRCENAGDSDCDYVLTISGENDGVVGHTVHVGINACNNYDGVAVADIDIVAKLKQTVTIGDVTDTTINKAYGDASFSYTATTNGDGAISYSSTNEAVATVDNNGNVTIVGVGEANIVATAAETDTYAEGTAKYTVSVGKKVLTVTNAVVENKTFDGTPVATINSVTLSDNALVYNTDYTAIGLFNGADAAVRNVEVMVALSSDAFVNYCFMYESDCIQNTSYSVTATILPFTLGAGNATSVLTEDTFTYNSEEQKPGATVTVDLDGDSIRETTLTEGTDYTISYDNNVNAGVSAAVATITGKGNYAGALPGLNFTINRATVTNVTVTAPAQDYTGEALDPEPTVMGDVNGETMAFSEEEFIILEHDDFINAGNHTFAIVSSDDSNYYIPNTNGTFTINKAVSGNPPEVSMELRIEAGKTLAELGERTTGFSWNDDTTTVAVGEGVYRASYLKNNDVDNYIPTEGLGISVYGLKKIEVTTAIFGEGDVEGPGATVLEGDEMIFVFTPEEGNELKSVVVNSEDKTSEVSNGRLVLTAGAEDTTVIVTYRKVYEVINGNNQKHIINVNGAAEFEINADYELFEDTGKVYVDGTLLDEEDYDSWEGSTIISLKASYLDTLAVGEHLLEVQFDDGGIARAKFVIAEKEEENPGAADTGAFTRNTDGAVVASASVIMVAMIMGGIYFVIKKRV